MKRVFCAAAFIAANLMPFSLQAADTDGRYTVKGAGATNCARFSTAVQERGSELISFAGWTEGYLSAMNGYEEGVYDIAGWRSTEVMLAALSRYCQANPSAGFHDAVAKMAEQMRPNALARQSPIVTIKEGGNSITLYRNTVERVQKQLTLRGIYTGPTDGEWNPVARDALQKFQEEKGVPATGIPDQYTLVHLLP